MCGFSVSTLRRLIHAKDSCYAMSLIINGYKTECMETCILLSTYECVFYQYHHLFMALA